MSIPEVGTTLPPLELPSITRTTLALFAGASGDHNPIHVDLDFARDAGMDDVFAHGMLSMAYLGRAVTGWAPQDRLRELGARFTAITPVNATPALTGQVTSVDDSGPAPLVTVELAATLADGTITLTGRAVVAWS